MYESVLNAIEQWVDQRFPGAVLDMEMAHGECTLHVDIAHIEPLLLFLRDDPHALFKQLTDICGADYPQRPKRFDVIYHLLSFHHNLRLRLKIMTDDNVPVPSVAAIYPAANWYEREVWDLYGVLFSDHPDLRRILTDYGFDGHPLRRDFPLTGYVEVRYDDEKKRGVYEPVQLNQAYRSFDYLSPWEGPQYQLPGDEKATSTVATQTQASGNG